MNELDKWSAEVCGVKEYSHGTGIEHNYFRVSEDCREHFYKWTLSDARCMEIFEERFMICTDFIENDRSDTRIQCYQSEGMGSGQGKTPKEARIACAKAIMEASK